MKINLSKKERWIFFGVGVIVILVLPWLFTRNLGLPSFKDSGSIGDTIGGVTAPFLNFFGAILVYLALRAQIDANSGIKDQFLVQQFESRFYKMIDLHVENVQSFSIQEFEVNSLGNLSAKTEINGRRVFLPMIKEFHFILEIVNEFYEADKIANVSSLNKLAYQIFFYGIDSDHVKPINEDDKKFKQLKKALNNFRNGFRNTFSRNRVFNSVHPTIKKEIKLRFVPFSGHESRLAVYFRHLYQTVKQVNESENKGIIEYSEARQYLAILRGQLTNQEQQLLYYNYLFGFGDDWDKLGGRHQFLTYYRMIHNIPLDDGRISELVENPRIHFKDYVENHCTDDDPLFDWGDFTN